MLFICAQGGDVEIGICERCRVVVHKFYRKKKKKANFGMKKEFLPMHVKGQLSGYAPPAQSPPSLFDLVQLQLEKKDAHNVILMTIR
jgi:hypothetical protein